jgi:hypothetical protein
MVVKDVTRPSSEFDSGEDEGLFGIPSEGSGVDAFHL